MGLTEYDYIATLGNDCTGAFQLKRAASAMGLSPTRYKGPFDWFTVTLEQVIDAIESDFRAFFRPARTTLQGELNGGTWRLADASGATSWHHVRRAHGETAPNVDAWFDFGRWLGERQGLWWSALKRPDGRILFVRAEDALRPDREDELIRLAKTLERHVAGEFRVAWVSLHPLRAMKLHSSLCSFAVAAPWPREVQVQEVEWDRDYGRGIAWCGVDAEWDAVWSAV